MPRELPILFKPHLVVKIIKGLKTQTRRIIPVSWSRCLDLNDPEDIQKALDGCRYGKPGDLLYVREHFSTIRESSKYSEDHQMICIRYEADGAESVMSDAPMKYRSEKWKGRPGIFMPKMYSRLYLLVKKVRVERIQQIPPWDIRAEGFDCPVHDYDGGFCTSECPDLLNRFINSWNKINGPRGYSWQDNNHVFAIDFDVHEVYVSALPEHE